jgi:S1-C subfamily serine protease
MKKTAVIIITTFLIAFLLGGAYIADQQGTNLWAAIKEKPEKEVVVEYGNNIATAAVLPSGAMDIADMVEKATPAVVNIKSKVRSTSIADNPFFNDPFSGNSLGIIIISVRNTKPVLAPGLSLPAMGIS